MVEVYKNLFVGVIGEADEIEDYPDWVIVYAAKEPAHRKAVGYTGRGCPKDHPEYLYAERDRKLMLNLVGVDNVEWISPVIINKAFDCIESGLDHGKKVFVCCNQGHSRSAVIALLVFAARANLNLDYKQAVEQFMLVYPAYKPGKGMEDYAKLHWFEYVNTL